MKYLIPLFLILAALTPVAMSQTTQPDDGPSVPPAMVPIYLKIGKEMSMQVRLFRRTVDELKLEPAVREHADQLMDDLTKEMGELISRIEAGQMPSNQRVIAMPDKLKAAHEQLLQLIGPDQAAALQEKIESIRGQARLQLAELRMMIDDLKLPPDKIDQTKAIVEKASRLAEALPDKAEQADDAIKSRAAMDHLLADAHDQLAAILSPEQQSAMGQRFAMLAMPPATQP